ncbi:electron transfer flavoprotein regulatory factor 1-like [Onthophagus taurus]|uniref:electron transfer flavoprotein regulatory factor 1-like n=1 Tax=Onthophagus taurus TaxID=166361 RepID=UPI0039BE8FE5
MSSQRSKVINLYKTLLHLGKDYPSGYDFFRTRLHRAFMKNKDEKDPEKIEKMLAHGQYIIKELEALYMLKKYRTMKRRYYNEDNK